MFTVDIFVFGKQTRSLEVSPFNTSTYIYISDQGRNGQKMAHIQIILHKYKI